MKSILAKQSPQRSPWVSIRARQEIQTGGSRRSATAPSIARQEVTPRDCVPLMSMTPMIPRKPAILEETWEAS